MMRSIYLFSTNDHVTTMWKEKIDSLTTVVTTLSVLERSIENEERHIVLLDLQSIDESIENILFRLQRNTSLYVFALSGLPSYDQGVHLLKEGVKGYANTYMDPVNLNSAIQTIEQGNVWVYPEFMQEMIRHANDLSIKKEEKIEHDIRLDLLTAKEQEVAHLVSQGKSNKEVASRLDITERTVKAHLSSIYMKLEIGDRLSLALMVGSDE